ncbi:MAG TPA: hypothetical protein VKB32_03905 [Actinomycetota bacterium]|nr:hypothetical protein [Actinomycetota bacterium]
MDRIKYSVMTRLAPYPSLAVPLARLRGEGELVDSRTDLLVESYPRCASSFAIAAFRLAQEPRSLRVAHHTHASGHVIAGIRLGIPALALIREPESAVVSSRIRHPARTYADLLRGFCAFYEPLVPHRGDLVVGTFDEVIGGELGAITRRLNARFGSTYAEFEPTEDNVARVMREIDQDWRTRRGEGERLERVIPRPSRVREGLKSEMRERYAAEAPQKLRQRAEELYSWFTRSEDAGS